MATIHITGSPQEVERLLALLRKLPQATALKIEVDEAPVFTDEVGLRPRGGYEGQIQVADDFDEWDEEMMNLLEGNNPLDPLNVWLDEKKNEGRSPKREP